MFLFKSKKQLKEPKNQLDSKLKQFQVLIKTDNDKGLTCQSGMKQFYDGIYERISQRWPQFIIKYDKQIGRVKKCESSWNYSDIRMIRNYIKKSMQQETLSILIQKWCQMAKISLFVPISLENNNINNPIQGICQRLKRQIFILCQALFRLIFQVYQIFFIRHYDQKKKILGGLKLSKNQIYQKQRYVHQDFIRNCLTCLHCFSQIYEVFLSKVGPLIMGPAVQDSNIEKEFRQFLGVQLNVTQQPKSIYKRTIDIIKQFHHESGIESKLEKALKIILAIEDDNADYCKKQKKVMEKRMETISTAMVNFLFKLYCPDIPTSMKYIRLLICYRFSVEQQKQKFDNLIEQFCFLWLHEGASAQLQVIFDAFI